MHIYRLTRFAWNTRAAPQTRRVHEVVPPYVCGFIKMRKTAKKTRRFRPWAACPRDNTGPVVSRSRRLKVRYSSLEQRTLMPIKACEGYRKRIIPRERAFLLKARGSLRGASSRLAARFARRGGLVSVRHKLPVRKTCAPLSCVNGRPASRRCRRR